MQHLAALHETVRRLAREAETASIEPGTSLGNYRYFVGQLDAFSRVLVELQNLIHQEEQP